MHDTDTRLARINLGLICFIIVVWFYIVVTPLAAQINIWVDGFAGQKDRLSRLLDDPKGSISQSNVNRLIVPGMLLDSAIQNSDKPDLHENVWHLPESSTPNQGGNTVLVSDRFSYNNAYGNFYFLDKLKPGDKLGVVWRQKLYHYKVVDSKTYSARQNDPLVKESQQPLLTLYSAGPLWYQNKRLVVTAQLTDPQ